MVSAVRKFFSQPLWLVGFRPFFSLAAISGAVLPPFWLLMFAGWLAAPMHNFSAMQWHAHEMLFGFGWAVIGGFLLTASKNWVQIRGYHGAALVFLVLAWIVERLGMWYEALLPRFWFYLSNNLFLAAIIVMLLWTLIRHRKNDDFSDNYFFVIALPLFLLAKNLLLQGEYFQIGVSMTIGLFRVAFLVMLERTLTQFMRNIYQVAVLRDPRLDLSIKILAVGMVFEGFLPDLLAAGLAFLLAALLLIRFFFWKPLLSMRRIDLGIMYLGYLAIVIQLVLLAFQDVLHPIWIGGVVTHMFSFGVMGLIIPAMLVRICKGHTGRKVGFDRLDKLVLWLALAAFASRLLLPQLLPDFYIGWLLLATAFWFFSFAILAWRYIPFLLQPRLDGREH